MSYEAGMRLAKTRTIYENLSPRCMPFFLHGYNYAYVQQHHLDTLRSPTMSTRHHTLNLRPKSPNGDRDEELETHLKFLVARETRRLGLLYLQ